MDSQPIEDTVAHRLFVLDDQARLEAQAFLRLHDFCLQVLVDARKHNVIGQSRLFEVEDWETKPETLLWQAAHGNLALPGSAYYIVTDQGEPAMGAGSYVHPSWTYRAQDVTIAMARMYTLHPYRMNFVGTPVLRTIVAKAKTPWVMVTFNDHNRALYESLCGPTNRGLPWPLEWSPFEGIGKHTVNFVDQWCAIAKTSDLRAVCK